MPELPEVEHTARQLRDAIIGATIREVLVFWERTIGHTDLPDFLAEVADREILSVRRRGKFLILDLSGELILTIHRRMTGNLLLLPPGWEIDTSLKTSDPFTWNIKGPLIHRYSTGNAETSTDETSSDLLYCRVCFNLADGRRLLSEILAKSLSGRKSPIKQVLLNQEVIAGLGNIYADEALYYASIHPLRRANSLTPAEVQLLHEGIVSVLTLGIEHGGTSFSEYRDLWGEAGDNYNHVRVYHQEGKPCQRCGTPIERIVVAQRSTHFCPKCQKLTLE